MPLKGPKEKFKRKLNQELIYTELDVEDGSIVFFEPSFGIF